MMSAKHAAPDPSRPFWGVAEVAAYYGVTRDTIYAYRTRGLLPPEDDRISGSPVWRPETIIGHKRPGRGYRSDRKRKDDA